jgi:hypothetical protein
LSDSDDARSRQLFFADLLTNYTLAIELGWDVRVHELAQEILAEYGRAVEEK